MKKYKKWLRLGALVMVLVCLASTASAASYTLDLSGDGKVNVWDLQVAVNESKEAAHSAAIMDDILGGGDELHPNSDGVYEIWTALGLYNMAELAGNGETFHLMADIDLGGQDWTPVKNFKGNFYGNNKTISNFKITKSVAGSDGANMGFFAVVDHNGKDADGNAIQSVVSDLNLVDVEITATEDARYIGLISGSNRGSISNCTTLGVVNDDRTTLASPVYIGTIVGRNNNSNPAGKVSGSNSMDVLEYYDYEPQEGTSTTTQYEAPAKVNSMMAMHFADLAEGSSKRHIGVAGYTGKANIDTSLVWQDITNSSYFDSQTLRDRRATVTASMYEMSTVEWTTENDIVVYTNGVKGSFSRTGGKVYRGIPYNHSASSIYRFLAHMDTNSSGRYTVASTVPTTGYYFNDADVIAEYNAAWAAGESTTASGYPVPLDMITQTIANAHQLGFMQYIGADCSSQTLMAWRTVNATSGTGKVSATHTYNMYMCEEYMTKYGIVPVNDFILTLPTTDLDGDGSINDHGDRSVATATYARANEEHYMQTLASVKKGDLLMDYTDEGGHTLMAMSDAVVIRTWNGDMDLDASYIVTAEQGGGGGTRTGTTADGKTWTSTCCVDEVNSFNTLYDVNDTGTYPSIFFPITCAALREEDTAAAKVTVSMTDGVVKSNFQIIASTVNGETVYAQIKQTGHRSAYNKLTVTDVHPDVQTGDTVEVLLANGETYTFTY